MRPEHWLHTIPLRLRSLFRWAQADQELDDELRDHLERKTEEYLAQGMTQEEAHRRARIDLDGIEQTKEKCRDTRRISWLQDIAQDLRYGLRMFRKSPGFTVVAILTLALGIGANSAIFSVVNGVLLQPLPYPHPEQLVAVARTEPRFDHPVPVSGPNFLDWRARASQFQSLAGFDGRGFTVLLGKEPENILGAAVSSTFFSVLEVAPGLGRNFMMAEEHTGNDHVAILTYEFWKERFGADPQSLGRTFTLNNLPFTIVGVLPPEFHYVMMRDARIFIPFNVDHDVRGENFMSVIGRLKPGVSLRQAQSEMDSIARALENEYPADNAEQGAIVIPMLTRVGMWIRQALLIMLAAVALVLLIACANIANLTLAQAVRRHAEIAVRTALGASLTRLVRQCLTESLLIGLLGGGFGVLLGYYGLQAFRALNPGNVPRLEDVQMNVRVLLFSLGISILASILFGVVPAFRASRVNVADTLREGSARFTSGADRGFLRQALVVSEIALSLVLLAGAGLAVRSFLTLISTDPGYDSNNLLTFYLGPQVRKAAPAENFYGQVLERMNAIPGVVSVSMSKSIPPGGEEVDGPIITAKNPDIDPNRAPDIIYNPISTNYFRTMRLPLLAGREFSTLEVKGGAPVVILNQAAARSLFPGENAVGQEVKLGADNLQQWWTVVGVVADERYFGWDSDRTPTAYLHYPQILQDNMPDYDAAFILRTSSEPLSFLPAVRSTLRGIDSRMALLGPESMEQRLANSFAPHRFNMALFATFAGLALLLAAVGIYGVMAQFVAQRTHEIGVRTALGARRIDIIRLVFSQGIRLALFGSTIGVAASAVTTRLIRSLLYGISPSDPLTFACVAALLMGVVLLACYVPARRAMRVDPMVALRYE
jgi:putative ABC transport system permease protein